MKNTILLILISLLGHFSVDAQANYVLNPSFEEYSQCPYSFDQIAFATHWSGMDTLGDAMCTPEYCNSCATNINVTVPLNFRFYHYPRTGNGMAQVVMFYNNPNPVTPYFRDYLQGKLYKPLTAGVNYCVTFYVTSEQTSPCAVNGIGAYIDNGEIDSHVTDSCAMPQTQFHPQIIDTEIINDTLNWIKIQGSFIANGGERFITIGNFHDDAHTNFIVLNGADLQSAYLIDDVSVVESDLPAFAGNDTAIGKGDTILIGRNELALDCKWYQNGSLIDSGAGIKVHPDTTTTYIVQQTVCGLVKYDTVTVTVWPLDVKGVNKLKGFSIYPNPSNGNFTMTSPRPSPKEREVVIYNVVGQVVYQDKIKLPQQVHTNLSSGIYLLQLTDDKGERAIQRLIISK